VSHPPYSEISSRKRDVHVSEVPLNLVLSGIGRKHAKRASRHAPGAAPHPGSRYNPKTPSIVRPSKDLTNILRVLSR
jgi:hypothetical protein